MSKFERILPRDLDMVMLNTKREALAKACKVGLPPSLNELDTLVEPEREKLLPSYNRTLFEIESLPEIEAD